MSDALGSTLALADSTGAVQGEYTYSPFGGTTIQGAANANSYEFTGRENDGQGLYYYRARYYDPMLSRFVSQDPAGFTGSVPNLYVYGSDSPTEEFDPTGLQASGASGGMCPPNSSMAGRKGQPGGPGWAIRGCRQKHKPRETYQQCVQGGGTTLRVADALGLYGLGSVALGLAETGLTSGLQAVYGKTAQNLGAAIAEQPPITTTEGFLAEAQEHALFLEGTLGTVGKLSGYLTIGATAVSIGYRAYCGLESQ